MQEELNAAAKAVASIVERMIAGATVANQGRNSPGLPDLEHEQALAAPVLVGCAISRHRAYVPESHSFAFAPGERSAQVVGGAAVGFVKTGRAAGPG